MSTPILLPIPPAYGLVLFTVSLALIFSTVQSVYIGPTRPRKLRRESLLRHRLQARGQTERSLPSPRASDYVSSVGVSSTSTTIRCRAAWSCPTSRRWDMQSRFGLASMLCTAFCQGCVECVRHGSMTISQVRSSRTSTI